ncbi:MAG: hypothetical protein FWG50_13655 [Kiritimatiellaeota bacterium]|nr:hypothetical protein [Kiritimatiellota bacterium]
MNTTLRHLIYLAACLGFATCAFAQPVAAPVKVGAIRWDCWGYEGAGTPTAMWTSKTLSPGKYHYRLPWYASVTGADAVRIPIYTREIIDREIAYAREAGIDYWAFVMYESGDLKLARDLYLSSDRKGDVKWAAILGASSYSLSNYPWLVSQFKEANYEKVLDGRPLVFVRAQDLTDAERRQITGTLRGEASRQGIPVPYIAVMDSDAETMARMQGDALTSYAGYATGGESFKAFAGKIVSHWNRWAASGAQVVPIVSTGWSPKPRLDNPVPWYQGYAADGWAEDPTAQEVAEHLKEALDWSKNNPKSSTPNVILIYAWNENDEGGWLIPTLGADGKPDTSRLNAVKGVLGAAR